MLLTRRGQTSPPWLAPSQGARQGGTVACHKDHGSSEALPRRSYRSNAISLWEVASVSHMLHQEVIDQKSYFSIAYDRHGQYIQVPRVYAKVLDPQRRAVYVCASRYGSRCVWEKTAYRARDVRGCEQDRERRARSSWADQRLCTAWGGMVLVKVEFPRLVVKPRTLPANNFGAYHHPG
jgi:hypothetical protein